MDFQLNPNAAEFVPVSPTSGICPTRMELDVPLAGSPLKQIPIMDDIRIPSRREFQNEARSRPGEIEEKSSSTNGNEIIADLEESEASSTKAEFGDDSSFLMASELHKPGVTALDESFNEYYDGFDDSSVDPMTKSFGPGNMASLSSPVDLNAVHDLTDADLVPDEIIEAETNQEDKIQAESIEEDKIQAESIEEDVFSNEHAHETIRASSPVIADNRIDDVIDNQCEIGESLKSSRETPEVSSVEVTNKERQESPHNIPGFYEDGNVNLKLIEMDLEDRGSQDCGFEKCNEQWNEITKTSNNEPTDFLSVSGAAYDRNFDNTESLPADTSEVEKMSESLKNLHTENDETTASSSPPHVSVPQNQFELNFDTPSQIAQDNKIDAESSMADYQVSKVPESPAVMNSPIVGDLSKNPFADDIKLQEIHDESSTSIIQEEAIPENPLQIEQVPIVTTGMKLSESLQEFTGLEQQLNPEQVTNGIESRNLLDLNEESKTIDVVQETKPAEPEKIETIVDEQVPKKETDTLTAVAVAATVATVATTAAVKSTKAKAPSKVTAKSTATATKTQKLSPTSPAKSATATARTSVTLVGKKSAAPRPNKLETVGKSTTTVASKTAAPVKSTLSVPKTTTRVTSVAPKTKPVIGAKTVGDKKTPTTNGDNTKSGISTTTRVGSATSRISSKLHVKSTTTTTAVTASATVSATAKSRGVTSTFGTSRTVTGTVGTTTQRPRTAPASTNLAAKSRPATTTKFPITEKQIKETANKQISSSRTSTTTTASKTSRASASSIAMKRLTASKTTTNATCTATATALPPPIRKPGSVSRVGLAKAVTSTAISTSTGTKTNSTKTTSTKLVQNGTCVESEETKVSVTTESGGNNDEDVPKKDLSPTEPTNDNQLIITAD